MEKPIEVQLANLWIAVNKYKIKGENKSEQVELIRSAYVCGFNAGKNEAQKQADVLIMKKVYLGKKKT